MARKPKTDSLIATTIPYEEKVVAVATTPMSLLQMAITQNVDMEKLERLMAMQEKWEAKKAKEAFFEALSAFQSECPEIKKVKKVDFTSTKTNTKVKYNFASLGDIEKQIKAAMFNNGLSKRFAIAEVERDIVVTCIITHKDGHSESTTLRGKLDDSGSKNNIQQTGSTITYLERYSLLAALGITTADTDNDGVSSVASSGVDLPFVTEEEYKTAMKEVVAGKWTVERILKNRSLLPEQKVALEIAEKAVKKDHV